MVLGSTVSSPSPGNNCSERLNGIQEVGFDSPGSSAPPPKPLRPLTISKPPSSTSLFRHELDTCASAARSRLVHEDRNAASCLDAIEKGSHLSEAFVANSVEDR